MFDASEKAVCFVERQHFFVRQEIQLTQSAQRFECARFLQKRVMRAVDELKRLHDKLDLANATSAKFDVALKIVRADYVALNASLDPSNLVEQIRRWTLRVNERLMLTQKFVSQLATPADPARLDQRKALPSFAEAGVIIFHTLEGSGERSSRTLRAKAKIDAKE